MENSSLEKLYEQVGRVAEMAQVMEMEAGNLALTYASIAFDMNNLTDEQKHILQSVTADVNRRTFGNLIRVIKKAVKVDSTIEETVDEALKKRNYFTHHFFRHHNFAIHSDGGRQTMVTELKELFTTFSRAHTMLHAMSDSLSMAFDGVKVSSEQGKKLMEAGERIEI